MQKNRSIKQVLLGTAWGRLAMMARSVLSRAKLSVTNPEGMAAQFNDDLATRLITRLPCRTFLDVGAHIGSVVAEVYANSGAKVIAIEAIPEKSAALRRKFPNLAVHSCAVGDKPGEVSFFVVPKASGYSSLIKSADSVEITVPLCRVDDIVKEHIDSIKIDVEGAELGVLRGAESLIDRCRPVVMFESAHEEAMYSKDAMWDWLTEHRYEVYTPDRVAHLGPALSRHGFAESHHYPRRTNNYFAIPAEKRADVRKSARAILGVVDSDAAASIGAQATGPARSEIS